MKILIVEDNEDSRNLLMKQIRAYGHEATATANGAEALEQALARPPDVIISDILMPKMDGYQLCHECKQNDKLKDIPFIFYTAAYTSEEDDKFALSLGANTLIRKPTEPDILVQMLCEAAEQAKSGALAVPEVAPLEPSLFHTEYSKRIFAKLEDKVAQLEMEITERKRIEHNLNERVKELQCLYDIAYIAERPAITLDELYQEVVNLLPAGWQYPEITCARVAIDDKEFRTNNYRETEWKLSADIEISRVKAGVVEVCYLEERPQSDEGPFLKEERELITAIVRHLGESIERKQSEEALRESEEKLRLMFDSVTEGITVGDLDGKITDLNTHVVHMHGYDNKEELIGRSAFELMAEKDRARAMENMKRTLEDGFVKNIEYTFLTRDGSEFPAELSAAVLKDASGKPTGFIAITEDITERKRMEEQLIVTDRLASIGELSSGIAHELNNPLTSVIGFSELLLEKDVPDDVKEDLRVINREAKRTAGVVSNLLTFARKHETERKPVDIHNIIQKVLEIRSYEQKVSNIEVSTRFASDLPEIMADGFRLRQVFLNIIINAEHFMTEAHGRGTLTITTERVGDIIRASFADDGPGIAKENLGHLFDPFFTTKEVGRGTGLGLSICHGIITEHGGRIYAESKLGKGATFVVELPISK